jgi:hypothetical protein
MKLYLLTTESLGDFYVLGSNPHIAESNLKEQLDRSDYGFNSGRRVVNFKLLAEEVTEFPKGKPNFSSGNRLILIGESR